MSVEFEQNNEFKGSLVQEQSFSGMSNFLIKKGLAKDTSQSNIILISVIVIFVIITFIVIHNTLTGPTPANTSSINPSIIKGYINQGLRGKDLIDRLNQDRASGLIK